MDYCIKNSKNVYIKLNDNGTPITCSESMKGIFEYSKAMNIIGCLPKTLKRLNFKVEAMPDIQQNTEEEKVISTNTYVPPENVIRWINEIGRCEDILNMAANRDEVLNSELSDVDLKLQDILHEIELSDKCDMYKAWRMINSIRELRKRRRNIKDEKIVLSGIRTYGITYLNRKSVQKCVDGLSKRKYRIRIVEEEEES